MGPWYQLRGQSCQTLTDSKVVTQGMDRTLLHQGRQPTTPRFYHLLQNRAPRRGWSLRNAHSIATVFQSSKSHGLIVKWTKYNTLLLYIENKIVLKSQIIISRRFGPCPSLALSSALSWRRARLYKCNHDKFWILYTVQPSLRIHLEPRYLFSFNGIDLFYKSLGKNGLHTIIFCRCFQVSGNCTFTTIHLPGHTSQMHSGHPVYLAYVRHYSIGAIYMARPSPPRPTWGVKQGRTQSRAHLWHFFPFLPFLTSFCPHVLHVRKHNLWNSSPES